MIEPSVSAPMMTPPTGAGLIPMLSDYAPIRACVTQPVLTEMAGEYCPIRAVVTDLQRTEYCPIRAVVSSVKNIGLRAINQSNRDSGIGVPVLHEATDL